MIDYYRRIAPWILPHLRDRPLTMERYPDGIDEPGFFHKAAPFYYPSWIKTVTVKKVGGTVKHVVCDDAATLVYLANQACLTPHIWLSRTDKLDYPDLMVFDLDPSGASFEPVRATAQSLKTLLDQIGLPAYVKTTGSRGLHVAVPLKRLESFDSVRAFARELARIVVSLIGIEIHAQNGAVGHRLAFDNRIDVGLGYHLKLLHGLWDALRLRNGAAP